MLRSTQALSNASTTCCRRHLMAVQTNPRLSGGLRSFSQIFGGENSTQPPIGTTSGMDISHHDDEFGGGYRSQSREPVYEGGGWADDDAEGNVYRRPSSSSTSSSTSSSYFDTDSKRSSAYSLSHRSDDAQRGSGSRQRRSFVPDGDGVVPEQEEEEEAVFSLLGSKKRAKPLVQLRSLSRHNLDHSRASRPKSYDGVKQRSEQYSSPSSHDGSSSPWKAAKSNLPFSYTTEHPSDRPSYSPRYSSNYSSRSSSSATLPPLAVVRNSFARRPFPRSQQPGLCLTPAALLEGITRHVGLTSGDVDPLSVVRPHLRPLRLSGGRFYGDDAYALSAVMQQRGLECPYWLTSYELAALQEGPIVKPDAQWVPLPSTLGIQVPPVDNNGQQKPVRYFVTSSTVFVVNAADTTKLHLFHSSTCFDKKIPIGIDAMPIGHTLPHAPIVKRTSPAGPLIAWLRQPWRGTEGNPNASTSASHQPLWWMDAFKNHLSLAAYGRDTDVLVEGDGLSFFGPADSPAPEATDDTPAAVEFNPNTGDCDAPDMALRHVIASSIELAIAHTPSLAVTLRSFAPACRLLAATDAHSPFIVPLWALSAMRGVTLGAGRQCVLSVPTAFRNADGTHRKASALMHRSVAEVLSAAATPEKEGDETLHVLADSTTHGTAFSKETCIPYYPTVISASPIKAPWLHPKASQTPILFRVLRTTIVRDIPLRISLSRAPQSLPTFVETSAAPLLGLAGLPSRPPTKSQKATRTKSDRLSCDHITTSRVIPHSDVTGGVYKESLLVSEMLRAAANAPFYPSSPPSLMREPLDQGTCELLNAKFFTRPEVADFLGRYVPRSLNGRCILEAGTFFCTKPSKLKLDASSSPPSPSASVFYQMEDVVFASHVALKNGYRSDTPWITSSEATTLGLQWLRSSADLPSIVAKSPKSKTQFVFYSLHETLGYTPEILPSLVDRFYRLEKAKCTPPRPTEPLPFAGFNSRGASDVFGDQLSNFAPPPEWHSPTPSQPNMADFPEPLSDFFAPAEL